jgi:aspartate racemase
MKHIGILAHSAEGAALCFLAACHQGEERLGAHNHAEITLSIVPMSESMDYWERNDFPSVREILRRTAERLSAAGADFFVCPDNTAHLALEVDGPGFPLPGLHIAEVVAATAKERGFARVGLLGTRWTMDGTVYANAFRRHGLDYRVPEAGERDAMNTIIFEELVRGRFNEISRERVVRMIEEFERQGCNAVALSCTEIPLLVDQAVSPLPILDSTRLLAKAAVAVALGDDPMPRWRGGPLSG